MSRLEVSSAAAKAVGGPLFWYRPPFTPRQGELTWAVNYFCLVMSVSPRFAEGELRRHTLKRWTYLSLRSRQAGLRDFGRTKRRSAGAPGPPLDLLLQSRPPSGSLLFRHAMLGDPESGKLSCDSCVRIGRYAGRPSWRLECRTPGSAYRLCIVGWEESDEHLIPGLAGSTATLDLLAQATLLGRSGSTGTLTCFFRERGACRVVLYCAGTRVVSGPARLAAGGGPGRRGSDLAEIDYRAGGTLGRKERICGQGNLA
jgi:hypothetical protein